MSHHHYADLAAALHAIADRLAGLDAAGLPRPWVSMSIQPGPHAGPDQDRAAAVDALAVALTGRPGRAVPTVAGHPQHTAETTTGPVRLAVFEALTAAAQAAPATREVTL